jgi:HAD superfamily hydrolase (TIGR01509 family)
MTSAVIFDVDGTLVQTERLKAKAYALAVQRLLDLPEPDERAVEAYREIVGASRNEASRHVMESLGIEARLRPLMEEYGVSRPEEVLTAMRLSIYGDMVARPEVLKANQWPHAVDVLRVAKESACMTALVTMSRREDTIHVVHSLEIGDYIDIILTADDVDKPKPDPEIYLKAAGMLEVAPGECLALEDSVTGVRAALAAGTTVVAIATPFTAVGLHLSEIIEDVWIVHRPEDIADVVSRRIEEHDRTAHRGEQAPQQGGE